MINGEFEGEKYSGSGCLIGGKYVLTCAHNIYIRKVKKEGTNITFTLRIYNEKIQHKIKKSYYPSEFQTEIKEKAYIYDYCILELEEDL